MIKKYTYLLRIIPITLVMISFACNSKHKTEDQMTDLPTDFLEFFERFHTDSTFQMASIQFPLEGKKVKTNDLEAPFQPDYWYPEDWVMHKPFKDDLNEFDRTFDVFSTHLIIEYIYLKGGKIGMERRFAKMGDQWKLIYYTAMSLLQDKQPIDTDDPLESSDEIEE